MEDMSQVTLGLWSDAGTLNVIRPSTWLLITPIALSMPLVYHPVQSTIPTIVTCALQ